MSDQHDGGIEFGLQVADQVEDLRLNGHVESGGRFVGDEQIGIARQGHGDHGPLPHPARELVRVGVDAAVWLWDSHPAEQVDGVLARHLLVHRIVDSVRLDDLVTHCVVGVHRRERVLKDHGHPLSAQAADVLRTLAQQLIPVEIDLTAQLGAGPLLLRSRPGMQAHDRQAGDALARPGLAHNAERPAAVDGETQPVDRLH